MFFMNCELISQQGFRITVFSLNQVHAWFGLSLAMFAYFIGIFSSVVPQHTLQLSTYSSPAYFKNNFGFLIYLLSWNFHRGVFWGNFSWDYIAFLISVWWEWKCLGSSQFISFVAFVGFLSKSRICPSLGHTSTHWIWRCLLWVSG